MIGKAEEAPDLLNDYANLLEWLADRREHDGQSGPGRCSAGCTKCAMLKKAERANDVAAAVQERFSVFDDSLEDVLRL